MQQNKYHQRENVITAPFYTYDMAVICILKDDDKVKDELKKIRTQLLVVGEESRY